MAGIITVTMAKAMQGNGWKKIMKFHFDVLFSFQNMLMFA